MTLRREITENKNALTDKDDPLVRQWQLPKEDDDEHRFTLVVAVDNSCQIWVRQRDLGGIWRRGRGNYPGKLWWPWQQAGVTSW